MVEIANPNEDHTPQRMSLRASEALRERPGVSPMPNVRCAFVRCRRFAEPREAGTYALRAPGLRRDGRGEHGYEPQGHTLNAAQGLASSGQRAVVWEDTRR